MATITRRPPACSGNSCQVGGFLAYASRYGRWFVDRALHLPERWAVDRAQRAEGRRPRAGRLRYQTEARPGHARAGARRGRPMRPSAADGSRSCRNGSAAGRWMTADNVDGADHALRCWLAGSLACGYVLAVTKAQRLGFGRVADLVSEVSPPGWDIV